MRFCSKSTIGKKSSNLKLWNLIIINGENYINFLLQNIYDLSQLGSSVVQFVLLLNDHQTSSAKYISGTYKVRNEIETKRNETKSTKTKRNETKSTKTKRNETKSTKWKWNKTKPTKAKRNQRKQNERLIWRTWKEKK